MERQECSSITEWTEAIVPSSDPSKDPYSVMLPPWPDGGFCTCPGFEYRGDCRHFRWAKANRCVWHSDRAPKQTPEQCRQRICPACGRETRIVLYADED